jgi:hypothetical protein
MSRIDIYEAKYGSGVMGYDPIESASPRTSHREGEELDAVATLAGLLADMGDDDVLIIHRVVD